MSTLFIHDSVDDLDLSSRGITWGYSKNLGQLSGMITSLDNLAEFNRIALEKRDAWCSFIASLEVRFSSGLEYFLSDLSSKRTEFFPAYVDVCHAIYLQRALSQTPPTRIHLSGCTDAFAALLKTAFPDSQFSISSEVPVARFQYLALRQFAFFLNASWKLLLARLLIPVDLTTASRRWLVTRHPLHLKSDLTEDKFVDLKGKNDRYLVDVLTDGLHQNLNGRDYIKAIIAMRNQSQQIVMLDSLVSFTALIKQGLNSFPLISRFQKLGRQPAVFEGFDVRLYLADEFALSALRVPRLLMMMSAFAKIPPRLRPSELLYYLHEYPYGRAITAATTTWRDTRRIGFQHGPASWLKMLYFMAPGEALKHPLPDEVWCEEELSRRVYEYAGYRNVQVMSQVPRLHYLSKIRRQPFTTPWILVACGLNDGRFLFEAARRDAIQNPGSIYALRLHPRANSQQIEELLRTTAPANLVITREGIQQCLAQATEVYVTYSSVGYEARMLGIPVRVLQLANRLDESPLSDPDFIPPVIRQQAL